MRKRRSAVGQVAFLKFQITRCEVAPSLELLSTRRELSLFLLGFGQPFLGGPVSLFCLLASSIGLLLLLDELPSSLWVAGGGQNCEDFLCAIAAVKGNGHGETSITYRSRGCFSTGMCVSIGADCSPIKTSAATYPNRTRRLMDRQTRELASLCILASICLAFAGVLASPWLVAVFAAEAVWALFMAVYVSMPSD
jgi:hypothetical protein